MEINTLVNFNEETQIETPKTLPTKPFNVSKLQTFFSDGEEQEKKIKRKIEKLKKAEQPYDVDGMNNKFKACYNPIIEYVQEYYYEIEKGEYYYYYCDYEGSQLEVSIAMRERNFS